MRTHLHDSIADNNLKIDYAILSAMPAELESIIQAFSHLSFKAVSVGDFNFKIYTYKHHKILIACSGIGTTFAASAFTFIHNYFKPEYTLFAGVAGGIDQKLKIGDVVIVATAFEAEIQNLFAILKDTIYENALTHPLKSTLFPAQYQASDELLSICQRMRLPANTDIGTAVTSNAFPAPIALFQQIKSRAPQCIDMETSAIYQTAWLLNAKALVIRGISNVLDESGEDKNFHVSDVAGSAQNAANILLLILNAALSNKRGEVSEKTSTDISNGAQQLIDKYKMKVHPEGGFYTQIFKSNALVKILSDGQQEKRHTMTAIYYLLDQNQYSAWHILQSDEIWHYYSGSAIHIYILNPSGTLECHLLGNPNSINEANFQVVIKAGHYFAAELVDKTTFSFVGCTVAPGFEYEDFKLADIKQLIRMYPQHQNIIEIFAGNSRT